MRIPVGILILNFLPDDLLPLSLELFVDLREVSGHLLEDLALREVAVHLVLKRSHVVELVDSLAKRADLGLWGLGGGIGVAHVSNYSTTCRVCTPLNWRE